MDTLIDILEVVGIALDIAVIVLLLKRRNR